MRVMRATLDARMEERMQGSRFREWRRQAGLTLQEVADLTGYSESLISKIETGDRVPAPATKVHISRSLGVRVADLFEAPTHDEVMSA